jgi:hypothetical protein
LCPVGAHTGWTPAAFDAFETPAKRLNFDGIWPTRSINNGLAAASAGHVKRFDAQTTHIAEGHRGAAVRITHRLYYRPTAVELRSATGSFSQMCNLYSITRSQEAMRRAFRVMRDWTGNLASLPAVFPDTLAPIVRTARDGKRELSMMRGGFPPPPNLGTAPVTNVRNLKSPYWRGWLKAESSRAAKRAIRRWLANRTAPMPLRQGTPSGGRGRDRIVSLNSAFSNLAY